MLTTLRISGFAIVDRVEVRFGPGLNVLTGETGAGKSILLQALHLVLGGRLRGDELRDGADEAVVEALFELPPGHAVLRRLAAAGLDLDPGAGELLVRRVAARNGRGRVFVNGALCTIGMLESSLRGLVDLTGQHEHIALADEGRHLPLLDAFAGIDGEGGAAARYREAYAALAGAVRERERLAADREERTRRADYLAFQLRELELLAPRPGEDAELERERQVLAAAERLAGAARQAEALVYGEEGSAVEQVGRAFHALADVAGVDARLEPVLAMLRSAAAELDEAGRALSRYAEASAADPERLAAVEDRLDALRSVARKHGGTLEAALARGEAMRAELAAAGDDSQRLGCLERGVDELGPRAVAAAAALTSARIAAADAFARQVGAELDALAMGRCRVEVAFSPPDDALPWAGASLGASGAERARILIAPNPGEPARPLARVASGGELSRILLAVKRAVARADPVETYVFDEVDAGIGGGVAEAVGRLLTEVSRERQVVCVTHLPQVAVFAERHFRVEKRVEGGRTSTAVVELETGEERRGEVARMLAGLTVTPSAVEHARALLAAARAPARGRARVPGRSSRTLTRRAAG